MTLRYISNVTSSWTSAGTTYTGIGLNVTATSYAAGSRPLNISVNGISVFSVDTTGLITSNTTLYSAQTANAAFAFANNLSVSSGDPRYAFAAANASYITANAGYTTANAAYSQANTASTAGKVDFFAKNSAPTGWLKANGAAVSRVTYADLFTAIGTTFGAGNGSTTFNLPDLRGYFIRGWVDDGTVDSGRSFGSTQTDAFQGHKHTASNNLAYQLGADGVIDGVSNVVANDASYASMQSLMSATPVTDGTNGTPRTATETRPVNVALLACIKY